MNLIAKKSNVSRAGAAGAILTLALLGGVLPACSAQGGAAAPAQDDAAAVVARVAGKDITQGDLEKEAAQYLKQLESQRQKILDGVLEQLVEKKLLEAEAAARGMTAEALTAAEIDAKLAVTDSDVDKFYEENKARIPQPKEQVAEQIRNYLKQQKGGEVRSAYIGELRKKHNVRIMLEPPREKVEVGNAPVKGPANAPVTIVEFSDFQCPFCSRVIPSINKVKETYGDKVRIAFRQFPLTNIHPNAQKAAEASLCANDQGKFWELHDAMFANQGALGVDQLKAKAVELGMNADSFNQCLDSGKHAGQVSADMAAGTAAGVSGTPAMFVNGRFLNGAVPFEDIAKIIDDELQRASGK